MFYLTANLKQENNELLETFRILKIITTFELNDIDMINSLIRNAKLSFKNK